MATICEMVLCLPNRSAASTRFLEAASRRNPVMASSRATTMTAIQAGNPAQPHKRDERRANQDFVRQRVHQNPEIGDELVAAGDAAVKVIRQAGGAEKQEGNRLMPAKIHEDRHQKGERQDKTGDG